jgi:protein involved in polysaccharide export with SLBB domain
MKTLTALLVLLSALTCHAQDILGGRAVEIRLQGVPIEEQGRINGIYSVSQSGMVRMPDVGEVHLAGMNTHAAAAKLDATYKMAGVYTNPTFQVIATDIEGEPRKDTVTLSGQVRASGQKPFTPGMTLFQAVAAAGGPTEFGSMRRVLLMRGKNAQTYDLNILENRNIPLKPDDTIEVTHKTLIGQ